MQQKLGCFNEQQLREFAKKDDVTVYQPVHDVEYEPWAADDVRTIVKCLEQNAYDSPNADDDALKAMTRNDPRLIEFAEKYQVFYEKLTTGDFVRQKSNVVLMLKLVGLRAAMEKGDIRFDEAQAEATNATMSELVARAKTGRS